MVVVDGAHFQHKYPDILIVVMTHDTNCKSFPIAFIFVEANRHDNLEGFHENLFIVLGWVSPKKLTVVSYSQKGLVHALMNIIQNAWHCYFCRHTTENIESVFINASIVMKFWHVTNTYRHAECEAYITDIRIVTLEAFNYIGATGRKHWEKCIYRRTIV